MADLNLEKFIKVVLMASSSSDGEALAAMRLANKMLKDAGVDWEKLLRGKVTVVADPFATIAPVVNRPNRPPPGPPAPPRPSYQQPSYQPYQAPPQSPPPPPQQPSWPVYGRRRRAKPSAQDMI